MSPSSVAQPFYASSPLLHGTVPSIRNEYCYRNLDVQTRCGTPVRRGGLHVGNIPCPQPDSVAIHQYSLGLPSFELCPPAIQPSGSTLCHEVCHIDDTDNQVTNAPLEHLFPFHVVITVSSQLQAPSQSGLPNRPHLCFLHLGVLLFSVPLANALDHL